ncbi:DUF2442 domain-containing protein [Chromobacterium sp. TRC.1.1.SA]|uniref:DUF2442 domain-containing protein n=1 Tax=Chromobacterium indicum TaxID=3110228 RepID=A0ABV0CIJ7_9NEIS
MEVSAEELEAASSRMEMLQREYSTLRSVQYRSEEGVIVFILANDRELKFRPNDLQATYGATPEQLRAIEISPSGLGVYFETLEEDVSLIGLLEGRRGSAKWMAEHPLVS